MMEKSTVPYDTMSVNSVNNDRMFSRCCCCIPLRIGCFILGYISLIINTVRTLSLVVVTLYCSFKTHGFDHIDPPTPYDDDDSRTGPLDKALSSLDQETIHSMGWILIIMTVCDLIWLAINIACLVGIHKKRPGPIRTFVGFATFRLLMTMAGYMYQLNEGDGDHPRIIVHCIDLGLTAYFILVYYIYAMKIEKEAHQVTQVPVLPVQVEDISYIYPTKLDKEHLVV